MKGHSTQSALWEGNNKYNKKNNSCATTGRPKPLSDWNTGCFHGSHGTPKGSNESTLNPLCRSLGSTTMGRGTSNHKHIHLSWQYHGFFHDVIWLTQWIQRLRMWVGHFPEKKHNHPFSGIKITHSSVRISLPLNKCVVSKTNPRYLQTVARQCNWPNRWSFVIWMYKPDQICKTSHPIVSNWQMIRCITPHMDKGSRDTLHRMAYLG